jgi:hypothetical protein
MASTPPCQRGRTGRKTVGTTIVGYFGRAEAEASRKSVLFFARERKSLKGPNHSNRSTEGGHQDREQDGHDADDDQELGQGKPPASDLGHPDVQISPHTLSDGPAERYFHGRRFGA